MTLISFFNSAHPLIFTKIILAMKQNPKHLSLYKKLQFGNFSISVGLGLFLGTINKNKNDKQVAPGIDINLSDQSKNHSIIIWVTKIRVSKKYFFAALIELAGHGMVSFYFVRSPSLILH